MNLVIGADHRGFSHKQDILMSLSEYKWNDVGCDSPVRCDFPVFVKKVVDSLRSERAQRGVLLCGSGIGMSIAANRFSGIYAALAWNIEVAKLSRRHNNANILVIPADFVSSEDAVAMVQAWLSTDFIGGKYQERIDLIEG